jgi:hypothetical protein
MEVSGSWRQLLNEELQNFYCWPTNISFKKSRKLRWAGHVELGWRRSEKHNRAMMGKSRRKIILTT